ncbi:MAG TPA: hypothetical protein VMW82_02135 [Candidatus Paceibacterota bacterium]|nr:hypothetical protein [Candidatus Paceibacterota bacterium]
MKNKAKKIDERQEKQKGILLEQLKKAPIIKVACERVSVSRATFYRWQEEDDEFRKAIDIATIEGKLLINDMSEFQLLSLIQEKSPSAIRYWLENHHPDYMKKGKLEERENLSTPSVIILEKYED